MKNTENKIEQVSSFIKKSNHILSQMFLKLYGDSFTQAEIKRIVNTIPNMQLDMDS